MSSTDTFARLRSELSRALIVLASVMLFAIMTLSVIDVAARDLFGGSIVGAFEITEIMMGVLVFAGLPIVTANEGHVAVTLLDSLMSPKVQAVQRFLVNLFCALILAFLAWRLWDVAGKLVTHNDITLFLKIPLGPAAYFMSVMTWISTIIQLAITFLPAPPTDHPTVDPV